MFDDIKTWLNNTGVLFHWAGSLRQSSSLTEVRSVLQWLHCWCHQSPPVGPADMILSGSKGIHPYQATPPHHIVRGYPTGVRHKVACQNVNK